MFSLETLMVLVPALPLAATLVTFLLGGKVLKERSHWPAVAGIGAAFVCSVMLAVKVDAEAKTQAESGPASIGYEHIHHLWTWVSINAAAAGKAFNVEIVLRADPLTAMMLCMVTFVSLLVAIYSIGYMRHDPGYWRFFTYIPLFVFSMTMLVSVSNFLLLYVFWEAVGVCSYLLIGFWFQKPAAAAAGKKAFLVNRVGDFAFALGVFLIWTTFASLDFHGEKGVFSQVNQRGGLTLICLLLFAGACGKSAQFPLHVWLPDAMEGPSPVSALIHAATMVTAGVYLVARCAPMFVAHGEPAAQYVVASIGAFTTLLAAVIAITQTDLKRILAYSTISQLGFMFLALGTMTLAGVTAAMFHLFTHAFFKALLFLGAGSVMHAMGDVIDIRRFGGLRRRMPITHWTFLAGCLALAGVVPLAGFWSKDAVLAAVSDKSAGGGTDAYFYGALYITALVAAAITAFYTFRAFFHTFYGEEKIPPEAGDHAHESPHVMTVPLIALAVFAVGAGAFALIYSTSGFLSRTPSLVGLETADSHGHFVVALLSTLAAAAGTGAAAFFYLRSPSSLAGATALAKSGYLYQLSHRKFFLDEIYYMLCVWPLKVLAHVFRFIDNFLVDGIVNLLGWLPRLVGAMLRPLQIGLIQFYALAMMLGLLVLIGSLLRWY